MTWRADVLAHGRHTVDDFPTWVAAANHVRALIEVAAPEFNAAASLARAPEGYPWSSTLGKTHFKVELMTGTAVAVAERAHSELGASSCSRWWNCPGSVALSRGIPGRSSKYADAGTAAHALAELCLRTGQDAAEYVGRTVAGVEVDAGGAEAVQMYLDDCRSLAPGNAAWDGPTALPSTTFVEVKFDLAALDPPVAMFGTADFVAYVTGWQKLYVKDYKNGYLHVEAEGNPQLKYYALGAMLALGDGHPVSEIEVAICQPNGQYGGGIQTATYGAVELAEWSIELLKRARATQEPGAPLNPGAWCKWCPAAGQCPARASAALEVAAVEFGNVDDAKLVEPALLSLADLARILNRADEFTAWLDAVAETAEHALQRGQTVPGWKLIPTQARDAWRDPAEAAEMLDLAFGMPDAEIFAPREIRSPAQVRDMLAAAIKAAADSAGKMTKKDSVVEARKRLAALVYAKSSGVKLAPDVDPRPALPTAGSEFTALPAEH